MALPQLSNVPSPFNPIKQSIVEKISTRLSPVGVEPVTFPHDCLTVNNVF